MSVRSISPVQYDEDNNCITSPLHLDNAHTSSAADLEGLDPVPRTSTEKARAKAAASPLDPFMNNTTSQDASCERSKRARLSRLIESNLWYTALILPLLPILGLAMWFPYNGHYLGLESRTIGGNLTQVQAKVIDFFCSVVIAPCIVTVFDYLWFSYARVLAVNEILPRAAIPIEALASTSSTDCGSFDMIKVWGLAKTKKFTLVLFGLMILLSGGTKSLLANVIAYEAAMTTSGNAVTHTLQSLAAPLPPYFGTGPSPNILDRYGMTSSQKANFSTQFLGLLTDMTFNSGANKLEDKFYIGTNTTIARLNSLPTEVGYLSNVPGYRMSIDCQAWTPVQLSIATVRLEGSVAVQIFVDDDPSQANRTTNFFAAGLTGGLEPAFGSGVGGATRAIAGFRNGLITGRNMYLGYLGSLPPFDYPENPGQPSVYGTMKWFRANLTREMATAPTKIPREFYVWGVSCRVTKQLGSHDLERAADGSWSRVPGSGRYEGETFVPFLRMGEFDWDLGYKVPWDLSMPGLGAVFESTARECPYWPRCLGGTPDDSLAPSDDSFFSWETMALNALYGVGETERMLNEVLMQTAGSNNTYEVEGRLIEQRYQITYVPLLVFGSLLSCLGACIITFSLLIYHWWKKSRSLKEWRKVTVTRLLIDAVDGFREEPGFYSIARGDNTVIKRWSDKFLVRYVKDVDEGVPLIKLKKA